MRTLTVVTFLLMGATLLTIGLLTPSAGHHPPREESDPPSQTQELVYTPPKGYVCYRAIGPIKIDGRLDEKAWQAVPWTDDFVDIEGDAKPKPRFPTRVKMLWDDQYFYVGAELEE